MTKDGSISKLRWNKTRCSAAFLLSLLTGGAAGTAHAGQRPVAAKSAWAARQAAAKAAKASSAVSSVAIAPTAAPAAVLQTTAPSNADAGRVTSVRFWSLGDTTRVAIEASSQFTFTYDHLSNPERMFFDIRGARPEVARGARAIAVGDALVSQIRVAETLPRVTRVVLDLARPVTVTTSQLTNPNRLIVELHAKDQAPHRAPNAIASPEISKVAPPQTSPPLPPPLVSQPAFSEPAKTEPVTAAPTLLPSIAMLNAGTLSNAGTSSTGGASPKVPQNSVAAGPMPNAAEIQAAAEARREAIIRELLKESPKEPPAAKAETAKPETAKKLGKASPSEKNPALNKTRPTKPEVLEKPVPASVSESRKPEIESVEITKVETSAQPELMASAKVPGFAKPTLPHAIAPELPPVTSAPSPVELGEPSAARNLSPGDPSLTRVLGLKLGRIVLDPGHGGNDVGTHGPSGYLEKDLVLDVAQRLGALLEQRMGSEVVFTRGDDTYIPLEERTRIANQRKADLFLSIHANSSPVRSVTGVETYVLNFTPTHGSNELAARENASSSRSMHDLKELVEKIAAVDKANESREFASRLQTSLSSMPSSHSLDPARNRGVKRAPFVVLIGASMPSVLAEIGFLTNNEEEALLRKPEHRQQIAEALFKGIASYAETLSRFDLARKAD